MSMQIVAVIRQMTNAILEIFFIVIPHSSKVESVYILLKQ